MFIIGDNFDLSHQVLNQGFRGCIERDFNVQPLKMRTVEFPMIDMDEWPERIAEMEAKKSRASDIRKSKAVKILDQNGQGFCWAYSTTQAVQITRAKNNLPTVTLSAHSVACKIKNFRDEGAWGALSLEYISKNGVVPVSHWPEKSMSRQYDNDSAWEEAKKYRVDEQWADIAEDVWDRTLTKQQIGTQLLIGNVGAFDYNWWGHSVCGTDLVDVYKNRSKRDFSRYGIRITNSWTENWGEGGEAVLVDSKAWPNGATFVLSVVAS
jgi:hypothetical protein